VHPVPVTPSTDALLERVKLLEARRVPVAWIPDDGSSFVPGQGYRVAIVIAGDDGYHPTGDWPFTSAPGAKLPWFWGGSTASAAALARAQAAVAFHNHKIGVTEEEAAVIIGRSMARASRS
jgi:hypothetical protein